MKERITINLDVEIVNFFKERSDRYQTAINEVLASYVHCYEDFRGYQREVLLEMALIQSLQLEEE